MTQSALRTPRLLGHLTFEEAAEEAGDPGENQDTQRPCVVLVPVGATEAHGPHLPLLTDVLLSEELCTRAQAALVRKGQSALIAPPLCYAVTEFGAAFPGTVSISPETATALYTDVCLGLFRGGFGRVCLINSHLEPAHVAALRAACAEVERRSGRRVAFPDHTERRWARTLTEEYRRGTCHAGRYETSLLLASRPGLVRDEVRRALPRNEPDFLLAMRSGVTGFAAAGGPRAYFGDPEQASAEEGDEIYDRLLTMVLTTLAETWPENGAGA
jgi:creatinine amidohydrolase